MRSVLALALILTAALVCAGIVALAIEAPAAAEPTPYVDRVVEYKLGEGGGFGEKMLPDVVLGPPHGGGKFLGGSDVLSLGKGGTITLEFVDNEVVDEPGPDFIIFENAFLEKPGDDPGRGNFELAKVEVSFEGREWLEFPYDPTTRQGCAGWHPVYYNPDTPEGKDINPADPEKAGGDPFDLADLKAKPKVIRFVRITDLGNGAGAKGTAGFDLDAVIAIHTRARKK
jgi:hypothetical protein